MPYLWNIFGNENSLTHDRIIKKGGGEKTGFQRLNAFPENSPRELFHSRCCSLCVSHCLVRLCFLQATGLPPEPGPACLQSARLSQKPVLFKICLPAWKGLDTLAAGRDSEMRGGLPPSLVQWPLEREHSLLAIRKLAYSGCSTHFLEPLSLGEEHISSGW